MVGTWMEIYMDVFMHMEFMYIYILNKVPEFHMYVYIYIY